MGLMAALLLLQRTVVTTGLGIGLGVDALLLLRVASLGVYYCALGTALAWLARRHGRKPAVALGMVPTGALGSIAWVLALLIALRTVATMYGQVAQALGWEPPSTDTLVGVFGTGPVGLALAIALVVTVGPLVEEFVFRGVTQSALSERFSPVLAVLGAGVLFAASHLSLWSFIPNLLLGLAAGWLVVARRSVWPAVALHSLYNAVAIAVAFFMLGGLGD